MATVIDRILERLAATGKTAHGASIEAGGSPSLIPNILNGRSKNPRLDTLKKIAGPLETTGEYLMNGTESHPRRPNEVRPADVPYINAGSLPRDVPVLGTVAGSELGKGAFQITDDVVDFVRRPPGLLGAKDVYALYVEGESMVPKFEPGELVFVHPGRKVLTNDYIVVQEPDTDNGEPRGFIKQFVKLTPTLLHTRQFNPSSALQFVIRPGLKWHKVVTGNDLYGV